MFALQVCVRIALGRFIRSVLGLKRLHQKVRFDVQVSRVLRALNPEPKVYCIGLRVSGIRVSEQHRSVAGRQGRFRRVSKSCDTE